MGNVILLYDIDLLVMNFLPDLFIDQDTPEKMYEKAGLNSNSIVEKIEEALKSNIIFAKNKNKLSN